MFKVMTDPATTPDTRPWRKRHPVVSRTLLYGLGLGVAVLLLVLFTNRKEDDERTRIAALQEELDGLSLVLATDPTGDAVLAKLDEKFSDAGLPVLTQGRALRWRAMVWRRKAAVARNDDARARAIERAEAALEACAALDLEPPERVALQLEWAEARLERGDVTGARAVTPEPGQLTTLPGALLLSLLRAQAARIAGRPRDALELAQRTVLGIEAPLDTEQTAYVGGRSWTAPQVAVELANFLTTVGDPAEARAAWNRLRAAATQTFDVQVAAARGLQLAGAQTDAVAAWRAARALNGDLAAAEIRREPALRALDRAASDR